MKSQRWLISLIMVLVIVVLAGCRRGGEETETATETGTEQAQLQDRVNQFLQERNITLPEGVERTDLESTTNGSETGVVTVETEGNASEVSVISGLPELAPGQSYQARLVDTDQGADKANNIELGTLRMAKGGYVVDHTVNQDISDYEMIQVYRVENGQEVVVLEGQL